ncbi:hypothetical protein [Acinetobacter nosocomialis]|uniref:hypothetical protein n=1 Tax=Acinetobacter nosocomialis TaxID=106654 RepID=UPI0033A34E3F
MKLKKSSKKVQSVKKTAPSWFRSPYNRLWYVLIQDPKQFLAHEDDRHQALHDMACEYFEKHCKAITFYAVNNEGELVAVIYYPGMFEDSEIEASSILCHESVHVWQEFAESINEREASREFEAYTIDEIFRNVLTEYRDLLEINKTHSAKKISKVKKEPDLV